MSQDPRRNQSFLYAAARRAIAGDKDLSRVGDELATLRRMGAPAGGFAKPAPTPAPAPLPPKPMARPAAPVPGENRRSALPLPMFVPPPGPAAAPAPEPATRRHGPMPTRLVPVRDSASLAAALDVARPGDHILLADGAYVLPNKRYSLKGTADRPIALVAAGRQVTLSGGGNPHTLQLDHSEFVTLNGLRFAPRDARTARALNVTDSNHVAIVGCWIGEGAAGSDLAPVHFGADASGRYNHHNLVLGNVVYAKGGAAVHFGPGGGLDARVVDNELRSVGADGQFPALLSFTPGGMAVYRDLILRGNRLVSQTASGAGILLSGVVNADLSGNTIRLKRDASGRAGALLDVPGTGGPVSGLVVHHNELGYDRPHPAGVRAPFHAGAPLAATFAHNSATHLGARLVDGKFAPTVDPASGLLDAGA